LRRQNAANHGTQYADNQGKTAKAAMKNAREAIALYGQTQYKKKATSK